MSRKEIPDQNILLGANSTVKLSIKTAFWLLSIIFGLVLSILTYSYYDLKSSVDAKHIEFVNSVNVKVEKIQTDVTNIMLGQESIRGDIKLILDRQSRDVVQQPQPTRIYMKPTIPPSISNKSTDKTSLATSNK